MKKTKKYSNKELAEAHVFPDTSTANERKKAENDFSAFRLNRSLQMKEEERTYSRLLQLKYLMEDYAKSSFYNKDYTFSHFLKEYIYSLNKQDNEFSKEINLHTSQLSRILNNKEEPSNKILIRLEIHSNNSIPALFWYRILEKQKELEITNDSGLRRSERKNVKAMVKIGRK